MSDRTYAADVESTPAHAHGLPDDPNLEMELATRSHDGGGDHDPQPPAAGALFPEIPTWTDEQLVIATELADRREPGLNLYAVGNLPDRHEPFLHECSGSWCGGSSSRGCGSRRDVSQAGSGPRAGRRVGR